MAWWCKKPWYPKFWISRSLPSIKKFFNNLCHLCSEKKSNIVLWLLIQIKHYKLISANNYYFCNRHDSSRLMLATLLRYLLLTVSALHLFPGNNKWSQNNALLIVYSESNLSRLFLYSVQMQHNHSSQTLPDARAPSQYKDRLIYVWRFPC